MIADVLMPVAVDTAYSYRSPPGLALRPGDLVIAPLGPRQTIGVVWAMSEEGTREHPNLKSLIGKADMPALPKGLVEFVDWTARWTLAPRGLVLRMALHDASGGPPDVPRIGVRLGGAAPERMTPARRRVARRGREARARRLADEARARARSRRERLRHRRAYRCGRARSGRRAARDRGASRPRPNGAAPL